jgi:hypothetical protein
MSKTTTSFGSCSICSSAFTFDDISALKCGHTFHGECINTWIQVSNNTRPNQALLNINNNNKYFQQAKNCPQCRTENLLTDIIKLYVNEEAGIGLPPAVISENGKMEANGTKRPAASDTESDTSDEEEESTEDEEESGEDEGESGEDEEGSGEDEEESGEDVEESTEDEQGSDNDDEWPDKMYVRGRRVFTTSRKTTS